MRLRLTRICNDLGPPIVVHLMSQMTRLETLIARRAAEGKRPGRPKTPRRFVLELGRCRVCNEKTNFHVEKRCAACTEWFHNDKCGTLNAQRQPWEEVSKLPPSGTWADQVRNEIWLDCERHNGKPMCDLCMEKLWMVAGAEVDTSPPTPIEKGVNTAPPSTPVPETPAKL
jgi:hypothetical protein